MVMKMSIKPVIIFFIIAVLSTNALAANNATVITLDPTTTEKELTITNNVFVQINVGDNSNRITNLKISVSPNSSCNYCQTAVLVNLSDGFNYEVIKQTEFPYQNIRHFAFYQNYTIFNLNDTQLNPLGNAWGIAAFKSYIDYEDNGNTTFSLSTGGLLLDDWVQRDKYSTDLYVGMPAANVTINSVSKFDVKLTYKSMPNTLSLSSQINSLSPVSWAIYKIFTLGGVFGESLSILYILKTLDTFFTFLELVFKILFVYPYLIAAWILIIIPNFYAAYRANSLKEMVLGWVTYYKSIGKGAASIGKYISNSAIWLIHALLNFLKPIIP